MYRDPQEAMKFVHGLSASDHTYVLKAVLESSLEIAAVFAWTEDRDCLSTADAVRLVAQCASMSGRAQEILNACATVNPMLGLSSSLVPRAASREVLRIALETAPIEDLGDLIEYLECAIAGESIADPNILQSLSVSLDILHDGASTIYNADYIGSLTVFSKGKGSAKEDAKDLGKADTAGAVVGGLGGAAVAGVGAGPGALAGAVTASTAKAVEKVIGAIADWLF